MHRGVPGRLHLRGRADALHPPRRVRRLRCLRAGLPGRGDLLRGRHARRSGRTTTRRTSTSSTTSARPAARRRSARSTRTTRWWRALPAAGERALTADVGLGRPAARLPLGPPGAAPRRGPRRTRTGIVDLSIGTPVDPAPAAGPGARWPRPPDAPGYPLTAGTPALPGRGAGWLARRLGAAGPASDACCRPSAPRSSSRWLPTLLGLGAGRRWCSPSWPTRPTTSAPGSPAREPVRTDGLIALGPTPRSGWSGSTRRPTRPAGCCRPSTCARSSPGPASAARSSSATSATSSSAGTAEPVSVLHPEVCGGDYDRRARGALAVQALQPGRLPGRLRRRRPGAGRRAARGAQARRA